MSIKTWFTSDTHFGHTNIIKFCNLPFENAQEMDEEIIHNWNRVVGKEDIVYHLGDVSFRNKQETISIFKQLNGRKHLIQGNHDPIDIMKECFHSVEPYKHLRNYNNYKKDLVLFHYPIESWNKKFHGSIHLHGHSHGTALKMKNRFDLWTGDWKMTPVLLEDILEMVDLGETVG